MWYIVVLVSALAGAAHAIMGALNAMQSGEPFIRDKFLVTLCLATMIGTIIGMQAGIVDPMGLFLLVFFSDYTIEKAAKIGLKAEHNSTEQAKMAETKLAPGGASGGKGK